MNYHQAAGLDFRGLPLKIIAQRYLVFSKAHAAEVKFRMALAGAKIK